MSNSSASVRNMVHEGRAGGRSVHTYDVPESMRQRTDGTGQVASSIGMVELRAGEELMATKIARAAGGALDFTRSQYEAAKMSIVEIDGRPVDDGDGTVQSLWEHCSPRLRSLILQVHQRMHAPTLEEEAGFFESHRVTAG